MAIVLAWIFIAILFVVARFFYMVVGISDSNSSTGGALFLAIVIDILSLVLLHYMR